MVQRRQTQRAVMVLVRGKYMHFACSSYKDGPIYLGIYIYICIRISRLSHAFVFFTYDWHFAWSWSRRHLETWILGVLWWFGKVLFAFYVLFVVIGVLRGCDGNERADCWLYKSFGWSRESTIQGASTLIVSIQFHTYALYFTVIWIGNAAIRDHNFDQFPGTQCTDLCLCQDLGSLRQQMGHLVGFNLRIWPTNKHKTLVDFRWQVEFPDIQEMALPLQPQNISARKMVIPLELDPIESRSSVLASYLAWIAIWSLWLWKLEQGGWSGGKDGKDGNYRRDER